MSHPSSEPYRLPESRCRRCGRYLPVGYERVTSGARDSCSFAYAEADRYGRQGQGAFEDSIYFRGQSWPARLTGTWPAW